MSGAPHDPRLTYAALLLAVSAFGLGAYDIFFRRPAAPLSVVPPSATPAAVGTGSEELQMQIAALRGEVAELRRQIATRPSLAAPPQNGSARDPGAPEATLPRVDVPNKAVSVMVQPNGKLVVMNSDPSLTGKEMTVNVTREDGITEKVSIVLPPPVNAPR